MIEPPGPLQRLVLEALAASPLGQTNEDIAKATGMTVGSVHGCTSGMVNFRNRHWVDFRYEGRPARYRVWSITPDGRAALRMERQKPERPPRRTRRKLPPRFSVASRTEQLIRENERMKSALKNIRGFAANSLFGAWRQKVYDMAHGGLSGS